TKICTLLGYVPTHTVQQGLQEALRWYVENVGGPPTSVEAPARAAAVPVALA
ncbi:MAG: hypothetical protein H0X65_14180, partial [Gemmatimonadetes bacterium]|nr:hypothetical protein [Gemmatimonadota bacterium]